MISVASIVSQPEFRHTESCSLRQLSSNGGSHQRPEMGSRNVCLPAGVSAVEGVLNAVGLLDKFVILHSGIGGKTFLFMKRCISF